MIELYDSRLIHEIKMALIDLVNDISNKEDIPLPVIYSCLVGGLIPLYITRGLFTGVCNNIIREDYNRTISFLLLKGLEKKKLISFTEDGRLKVRREVKTVLGCFFKSKIQNLSHFNTAINYIYKLTDSNVNANNIYNYYIATYYKSLDEFELIIEECIRKKIDLQLASFSVRELLDLESSSTYYDLLKKYYYRLLLVKETDSVLITELKYLINL